MPTFDGLSVNPCIPQDFGDYTIRRTFREGTYTIHVENPDHVQKGVKALIVDGAFVEGNVIPYIKGKAAYDVRVVMG